MNYVVLLVPASIAAACLYSIAVDLGSVVRLLNRIATAMEESD